MHEILLELALASKPGNDTSELLTDALPLFVQRLGCLAAAVLDVGHSPARKLASLPRNLPADSGLDTALMECKPGGVTEHRDDKGRVSYLWHLGADLRLLLLRASPLDVAVLRDLGPVINHLANALELSISRSRLEAANIISQRLAHLLGAMSAINRLIATEDNRDRLLEKACHVLVGNRGYFNAWITLLEEGKPVQPFYRAGFENAGVDGDDTFSPMADRLADCTLPHCAQLALSQGGLHIIQQPTQACGDCPLAMGYAGRVGLTARLDHDDRVYGWLTVSTDAEHAQNQREQDLLWQVAADLAHAVHALEIAQQQRKLLQTLTGTGRMFASLGPDSEANIATIVREACELTDGAASLYNRLDVSEKSLLVWSGHNVPADMPVRDAPSGHICYEATIHGQDQTVALGNLDETEYQVSDPNVAKYGLKSYLGHPVQLHGKAIGSLAVVDGKRRAFRAEEIGTIQTLARALSLEEERLFTLERLAHINRVLKAIRDVNHLIVHAVDAESLLAEACRLLVDSRGLLNAWIVQVEDGQPIPPVYHAGEEWGLSRMADSLCVNGLPRCARHVMQVGGVYRVREPTAQCDNCPMARSCEGTGFSTLNLVISHGQEQYGWLSVSVPAEYADDIEEHGLLLEVAGDLGFSLHAMKVAQKEARHSRLLTRRQEAQGLLTAISARLLQCSVEETDAAIELALGDLAGFAGADRAYVFLFSADATQMSNTYEWCAADIAPQLAQLQGLSVDAFPWWMARLDRGETIFIEDLASLPFDAAAERAVLKAQGIHSLLVMPMGEGRSFGYLGLDWVRQKSDLEAELIPLLQLAGNLFRGAIARLQGMQALLQREEEFRLLVENQHDLVVKVDLDGRFEFVSPSYCKLFGKAESELLGHRFLPLVHEEDQAATLRAMESLLQSPHQCQVEQRAMTINGWRWLDWYDTAVLDDAGKVTSIIGAGRDVTDRKLVEAELRRTLEDVVHLLGRVVEHRDPYTSGHQNRVAQLARAIATRMGLPAHTIESVYMGGLIHDIGKMAVPAEILSKPGKLASYEFTLIQQHPLTGYDILRDLTFPWDIAKMVLQHHEKLDGSGYPHGISGDEILLEARILTVADVVEAMASHRPYRVALGIDTALAEINRNSGRHYDPEVVQACLSLFSEQAFAFE